MLSLSHDVIRQAPPSFSCYLHDIGTFEKLKMVLNPNVKKKIQIHFMKQERRGYQIW